MKTTARVFLLALVLIICTSTAWASNPPIQGSVSGIELCPQYICGAAIFTGSFHGLFGNNPNAFGSITAVLTHQDLPPDNLCSFITGGSWELKTLLRRAGGTAEYGGTICNNADGTFNIHAILDLSGGGGTVTFDGKLNHNTPIPTFGGFLH